MCRGSRKHANALPWNCHNARRHAKRVQHLRYSTDINIVHRFLFLFFFLPFKMSDLRTIFITIVTLSYHVIFIIITNKVRHSERSHFIPKCLLADKIIKATYAGSSIIFRHILRENIAIWNYIISLRASTLSEIRFILLLNDSHWAIVTDST